jgi:hypothetical protein
LRLNPIMISSSDAAYGPGFLMTTMHPSTTCAWVNHTNYDKFMEYWEHLSKLHDEYIDAIRKNK